MQVCGPSTPAKKKPDTGIDKELLDTHADDYGWVWGAVNAKGPVEITAEKKGKVCVGCHLQEDNIDMILMNKYFT